LLRPAAEMMRRRGRRRGRRRIRLNAGLLVIGAVKRLLDGRLCRERRGGPGVAFSNPMHWAGGWSVFSFPPDVAVGEEGDVGIDGVVGHAGHGVGVERMVGAGGDAEIAGFGIDGAAVFPSEGLTQSQAMSSPTVVIFQPCCGTSRGG